MRLISRSYKVRPITDADRGKYARFERYATERGDAEEADYYRSVIPKWETEVGQDREALVCAVCGDSWLTPTRSGNARRHKRRQDPETSWARVSELRKAIRALNEELDLVLMRLESSSEP